MEGRIRMDYSPSLKHRLKHSICGCFKLNTGGGGGALGHHPLHHHHHHHHQFDDSPTSNTTSSNSNNPRLMRSSSGGGFGSGRRSDELFHIKDKCRNLINKIGTPRGHHSHHRKSRSTDFRYDPLSYSLNFDEGGAEDDAICVDELPLRNFSARLPPSPSRSPQPTPPLTPQPQPPPPLSPLPRPQHRHASDGAIPQTAASPSTPSRAPPMEITAYS